MWIDFVYFMLFYFSVGFVFLKTVNFFTTRTPPLCSLNYFTHKKYFVSLISLLSPTQIRHLSFQMS